MTKLWLDDVRPAPDESWHIVRNYKEFVSYIDNLGVPDLISFDHDLGLEHYEALENDPRRHLLNEGFTEKTGYDCAKYLVRKQLEVKDFKVHSQNPIGQYNITSLLNCWKFFYEKNLVGAPLDNNTEK